MDRKELINFFLDLSPTEREFLFWHCRNRKKQSIMTLMLIRSGTYDSHLRNIAQKLPPPHSSKRLKDEVCEEYRILFPEESVFFVIDEIGYREPDDNRWAEITIAYDIELKQIERAEKELENEEEEPEEKPDEEEITQPLPTDKPEPTPEEKPEDTEDKQPEREREEEPDSGFIRPEDRRRGQERKEPPPEPPPEPPVEPRGFPPRWASILIGVIVIISICGWLVNRCVPVFLPDPTPRPAFTQPVEVHLTQTYLALPTPTITPMPTITPTSGPSPTPESLLFYDDFETGLSDRWEVVSGEPVIANGMLTATTDTWLLVGDPSWENYIIEIIRPSYLSPVPIPIAGRHLTIGLHAQNINNMIGFKTIDNGNIWIVTKQGAENEIQATYNWWTKFDVDWRLILSVEDNNYVAKTTVETISSYFDETFQSGRVAILIQNRVIDSIRITSLP